MFKVYHWDTFDNETLLIARTKTIAAAEALIQSRYVGRIDPHGADKVDIVNAEGDVIKSYQVK